MIDLKTFKSERPFIIADLGSNYLVEKDLMNAIALAKNCGADAIKYQFYSNKDLYGFGDDTPTFKSEMLAKLAEKAKATGIEFMCTAFSPARLRIVNEFVRLHKIASSEMTHLRLLEAALETNKPLIISTGAHSLADIEMVMQTVKRASVCWLHCNHAYPAKFVDLKKFEAIQDLIAKYGNKDLIGFSDHTTSIDIVPPVMKNYGASVYEKHFNPFEYDQTPDAPHSLNINEFKAFAQSLRGIKPDYSEDGMARLRHIRRVVALKDIALGEVLKEGVNMGIGRSLTIDTKGMHPFRIQVLENKITIKALVKGEGIGPFDTDLGVRAVGGV